MALAIVSFTMQSGALGKPGQIQTTPFQHSSKEKMHIMQISMQKRQRIECSGHTGIFHHPHYISLGPVKKTALWRWNFHTEVYSLLQIYTTEDSQSKSWFKSIHIPKIICVVTCRFCGPLKKLAQETDFTVQEKGFKAQEPGFLHLSKRVISLCSGYQTSF